jgi:HEPN domain-containing protein
MKNIKMRGLLARASKDFEMAKRYRQLRDYVTAMVLYNKAVENVLTALFISKTKKAPPKDASIGYLAKQTGVPEEISAYINSMQKDEVVSEPAELVDLNDYGEEAMNQANAERQAWYMDGLAKRLIDYVYVKTRI